MISSVMKCFNFALARNSRWVDQTKDVFVNECLSPGRTDFQRFGTEPVSWIKGSMDTDT